MSESLPADTSADPETLFANAVHGRYGVRLAFLDKQRANDAADRLSPSYVLHGTKESLHLVYLVAAEEGERLKALVVEWQRRDTADAFVEFDVIAPDDEDEFRLHEDDAAHLVAGVRIALRSSTSPENSGCEVTCQPRSTNDTTIDQRLSISSRFRSSGISWSSR